MVNNANGFGEKTTIMLKNEKTGRLQFLAGRHIDSRCDGCKFWVEDIQYGNACCLEAFYKTCAYRLS